MKAQISIFIGALLCTSIVHSAHIDLEKNLDWASNRDLSSSEFSTRFNDWKSKGYMITDVDGYPDGKSTLYAMIWQENRDGRGWVEYRDMTSDQYHARWEEYKNKGYRPVDVEVYKKGNSWLYAGIWMFNKEKLGWSSRRNMTSDQYSGYFNEQKNKGYRVVDLEAYSMNGELKYSAIWVENRDNTSWAQLRNMDRATYQKNVDAQAKLGRQVVDYEAYEHKGKMYYAAIWQKPATGTGWAVRTDISELTFANYWREYADKGMRPIDFERYDTPSGTRYGGVWMENRSSRYDYTRKGELDTLVKNFQQSNDLAGLSAAVIRNGTQLYRRGFGQADVKAGKNAHGGTVYYTASIAKAVAATLAARLEQQGEIDLSRRTRSFLKNVKKSNGKSVSMPSHHTHTLEQLLSHTGCVRHYKKNKTDTLPAIPGMPGMGKGYYKTDVDAADKMWGKPLMAQIPSGNNMVNCNVGQNYYYSTHAFTFVGAALEKVTGRNTVDLFQRELFSPFALGTLRFSYIDGKMASDYDRAIPYERKSNGKFNKLAYDATSWKRLGGGMETSAVDLARFGSKVLNGEIVSDSPDSSRDGCRTVDGDALNCRLWTQRPNSSRGLAWRISTRKSRRVASHGGDGDGFTTQLMVFRDNGLVVAIMSNTEKDGFSSSNLSPLGDQIADIVLRP